MNRGGVGGVVSVMLGLWITGTQIIVFGLVLLFALAVGILLLIGAGIRGIYRHYRKPRALPRDQWPKPSMSEIIRR